MKVLEDYIEINRTNFDSEVNSVSLPLVLLFWAAWSGTTQIMLPAIGEIPRRFKGEAIFARVDIDRHPDLYSRFAIKLLPAFVILDRGRIVSQVEGVQPKETLEKWISIQLAQNSDGG